MPLISVSTQWGVEVLVSLSDLLSKAHWTQLRSNLWGVCCLSPSCCGEVSKEEASVSGSLWPSATFTATARQIAPIFLSRERTPASRVYLQSQRWHSSERKIQFHLLVVSKVHAGAGDVLIAMETWERFNLSTVNCFIAFNSFFFFFLQNA